MIEQPTGPEVPQVVEAKVGDRCALLGVAPGARGEDGLFFRVIGISEDEERAEALSRARANDSGRLAGEVEDAIISILGVHGLCPRHAAFFFPEVES